MILDFIQLVSYYLSHYSIPVVTQRHTYNHGIYFSLYSDRNPLSIIEIGWSVDYKLVCPLYKQVQNIDKGFDF